MTRRHEHYAAIVVESFLDHIVATQEMLQSVLLYYAPQRWMQVHVGQYAKWRNMMFVVVDVGIVGDGYGCAQHGREDAADVDRGGITRGCRRSDVGGR